METTTKVDVRKELNAQKNGIVKFTNLRSFTYYALKYYVLKYHIFKYYIYLHSMYFLNIFYLA